MNNNVNTERALLAGCKGVFSTTSYITIGSKDKPEDYVKQNKQLTQNQRTNFKGKQFATEPPKEGRTNDAYFGKEHLWVFKGEQYKDRLRYADTQKEKKKGFGTGDFKRRDEYSNTIRTEQYREQLSQESKYAKKALDLIKTEEEAHGGTITEADDHVIKEGTDKPFLFDLVFDASADTKDGASKVHRDTRNPTRHTKERTMGTMKTTSLLAHGAPTDFDKPQFARKPIVRDTFYRKTNIFFPSNAAASDS